MGHNSFHPPDLSREQAFTLLAQKTVSPEVMTTLSIAIGIVSDSSEEINRVNMRCPSDNCQSE